MSEIYELVVKKPLKVELIGNKVILPSVLML